MKYTFLMIILLIICFIACQDLTYTNHDKNNKTLKNNFFQQDSSQLEMSCEELLIKNMYSNEILEKRHTDSLFTFFKFININQINDTCNLCSLVNVTRISTIHHADTLHFISCLEDWSELTIAFQSSVDSLFILEQYSSPAGYKAYYIFDIKRNKLVISEMLDEMMSLKTSHLDILNAYQKFLIKSDSNTLISRSYTLSELKSPIELHMKIAF